MYEILPTETLEEISQDYPSRLVVMLYDEAIAGLEAAKDAIGRGDIEARFTATTRTAEVISQLYLALDMDQGGTIAENLGGIYNFVLTQIPAINFRNAAEIATQCIEILKPIRDSWFELDERIRAAVADSENGAPAPAGAGFGPALVGRTGS